MRTPDEREDRPSASSMERLMLCPGSHQASRGIDGAKSEAADSGSRIHALIAGDKVENITNDEEQMAWRCNTIADRLVLNTFYQKLEDCSDVSREERLWAMSSKTFKSYSGKGDLMVTHGEKGLVIDFKTGRGEVSSTPENMQLRTLAALMYANGADGVNNIGVAIIQPLVTEWPIVAWYEKEALKDAQKQINAIVKAAEAEGAPRIAGEKQCLYCPARARCPEANNAIATMTVLPSSLAELTSEQLSQKLDACILADTVVACIREEARHRIESGEDIDGWEMKAGAMKETITKPEAVFAKFTHMGGTSEQFMAAVSIAKGKLQDAVRAATGKVGKELVIKMENLLAGCTEEKQNAPSLKKKAK